MGVYIKVSDLTFEAFKKGDERAFRTVFNTYSRLITAYVLKFCRSVEEAEDLVHESFVSLYLNRTKIANAQGLYPYVFTIAKRLTISSFRKRVSETRYKEYLKEVWKEDVDTTQQALLNNDLKRVIKEVVDELPPRQKEIYLMNKQEELSYLEISALLDISIHTVKNHLVAALKHVKLRLSTIYSISLLLFSIFYL